MHLNSAPSINSAVLGVESTDEGSTKRESARVPFRVSEEYPIIRVYEAYPLATTHNAANRATDV